MHTEWDTQTVTNTLALYGVRRHSRAYHITRGIVRATLILVSTVGMYAYALTA